VGIAVVLEIDKAWTKFSQAANTPALAAGGDGGTVVLTLNGHVTAPGFVSLGFHLATLLNSPLLASHE